MFSSPLIMLSVLDVVICWLEVCLLLAIFYDVGYKLMLLGVNLCCWTTAYNVGCVFCVQCNASMRVVFMFALVVGLVWFDTG